MLFSCEVPYKDNARLLIKGQVLDENSQPISGANISILAREGVSFLSGSATTLLNEIESLSDGSFSTIMLLPLDENFAIEVAVNTDYSLYQYRTNTLTFTPDNYLIDLGTVPIRRNAIMDYNIVRENVSNTAFTYTFHYQFNQCVEIYANDELDVDETFCFEMTSRGRSLSNDNPNDMGNFITPLGSEVVFTYSTNGQPEESQTIIIDETTNEFNFSY